MVLAVLWEISATRIFCSRKVGCSTTLTGRPVWGVLAGCVKINYPEVPVEPLVLRKQGAQAISTPCTLTACTCRGNHFSAPFRFYLLVIFSLGWKGFSLVLSRGTNLTECIRNCSIGISLGFYWGWSAQTKCGKSLRAFEVTSMPRSHLAELFSCSQRCRQC